ncbi:PAS domain-containing protein [Isoptericola hypogeus]|uniref:PAS domain-containing protein n=1 Tax=Isoptericola hypogeus TaxID=300179 RepID=UPI0031E2DF03
MPLAADDLAASLAVGTHVLVGQYRVDLGSGRWWWSDEVFLVHGYEPGGVEPGLEVMRARQHPDDRDRVVREAMASLRTGRPFACAHRVVDARGRTRELLVTGQVRRGRDGRAAEVVGYVVDATPLQREAVDREVRRAIDSAFVSAASIEQAKGVLMATRGLDAAAAERVLAEAAGAAGCGLREAAAQLMAGLSRGSGFGEVADRRVQDVLAGVRPSKRPHVHEPQLARRRTAA